MVNNADYNSAKRQAISDYSANPYAYHNPFERGTEAWQGYDDGWMDAQWNEASIEVMRKGRELRSGNAK